VAALRAALNAQDVLGREEPGRPPLRLKAGIHFGPCIAVSLNDRLDYFGSTVNIAARLEAVSQGEDIVISSDMAADPAVAEWLNDPTNRLSVQRIETMLKGFDQFFDLYSVKQG